MLIINCKSALTITDSDLCFLFCPSTFSLLFICSCITASVFLFILALLILSSKSLIIMFSVYQLILSNVVLTVFPSISLAALLTIASLGHFSHRFFFSFFTRFSHLYFALSYLFNYATLLLTGQCIKAIVLLCQFFLTN